MKKIIAVVGMCGAGKSVVCDYLEKLNFHKLYFGGITLKKMAEANIERTPDNERIFRENLRKEYGKDCYAKFLYPDIVKESKNYDVVLDGLYSWYEYTYLKEKFTDNLIILGVICDKNIRYERISQRKDRPFDKQKAIERDISEIENLYKGGPIAYADYYVLNNTTVEDVYKQIDEILNNIK